MLQRLVTLSLPHNVNLCMREEELLISYGEEEEFYRRIV